MRNAHQFYMDIAKRVAEQSYCERSKVGCILVKDDNILSFGYNGTPSGFPNKCEIYYEATEYTNAVSMTLPEVLHAESNAISKCAKNGMSAKGATLYVTISPCIECAKLIIQAGIKRVIFDQEYRNKEGLMLLSKAGINWKHLDEPED